MEIVSRCLKNLKTEIVTVSGGIKDLNARMGSASDGIKGLKTEMGSASDGIKGLNTEIRILSGAIEDLKKKIETICVSVDNAPKLTVTKLDGEKLLTKLDGEELPKLRSPDWKICKDGTGQALLIKVALKNEAKTGAIYPLIRLFVKDEGFPLRDKQNAGRPGYVGDYIAPERSELTTIPSGESVPRTLKFNLIGDGCSHIKKAFHITGQNHWSRVAELNLSSRDQPSNSFYFKLDVDKPPACEACNNAEPE